MISTFQNLFEGLFDDFFLLLESLVVMPHEIGAEMRKLLKILRENPILLNPDVAVNVA